ncbi:MAG TPA: hypothetical protein VHV74_11915 [Pseudonocardiaceae bacterium]|nr:hypothetical protein [Pseudonocardiaceae bacterium]
MEEQTKVTTAVLAGYVLGRTKQGKRALRLAMWLGGGSGGVASNLAQQAKTGLVANPALAALLTQVRGPLADAARKAVTSAVENRANSLADALQNRTASLSLPGGSKVGDIIDADGGDEEPEPEPDEDETPPPRQRRSRSESATRRTRQTKADTGQQPRRRTKEATEKTTRAKRDTSKTASTKREPAKRTTKARQPSSRSTQSGSTRRRGSTR